MKISISSTFLALFRLLPSVAFAEVAPLPCSVNVLVNLSFPQGGIETGYMTITESDLNNPDDIFSEFRKELAAKGYKVTGQKETEPTQYVIGLTSILMKAQFGGSYESTGALILERNNGKEKADRVAKITISKNEMYWKTSSRTSQKAQKSAFSILISKMPECIAP